MNTNRTAPRAKTVGGVLEGRWTGEVASFLGIPYAEPPIGELRWNRPRRARPWSGKRSAREPGPVVPQLPSRLEAVMGPMQAPQPGDDCLSVNVWTPAPGSNGRLPTLVFIHGGGYQSGAGSAAWHEGARLAARGPAVVVTINYRLGALGYLYLSSAITDGPGVANLGLQDQRMALEWVQENIAAFGGDPGNVTVFGQSGGAHSILGLAAAGGAGGLFNRAILQSAPLGMAAAPRVRAEATASRFMEAAGVPDGSLEQLRSLPIEQILCAQRATMQASFAFGAVEPPFQLVVDEVALPVEPMQAGLSGALDDVDMLIGFTREDCNPFFCADDATWTLDQDDLLARVSAGRGRQAAERLAAYLTHSPEARPAAALAQMVTDEMMIAPALELVASRLARGVGTHVYRFAWAPDATAQRLGACHTIELPFVFANFAAWSDAPMLGGARGESLAELASLVQDAWLNFAACGDPSHAALPGWEPFQPGRATVMELDAESRLVEDPAEGRRDLWPKPLPR